MKTITRLFLVGLIAFGMTACSNEDEIQIEGQPESTVSVRVVPASNGPVVRSIGDLSGATPNAVLTAESEIKTLEVYVFSGESPDGYGIAQATEDVPSVLQVAGIATHSGPKTIVVVANASVGQVTSKAVLLAKMKDLPVIIGEGLPMTGVSEVVTLVTGLNQYGFAENASAQNFALNAPLELCRVNARVAIVGAALANNITNGDVEFFDGLSDVQVAMFNVPKTTKLFGTSLAKNADFLHGDLWISTAGTYTAGIANTAFLEAAVNFPIVNTDAPYFYVNENTSTVAAEKMMIVLRAKPTKGGSPAAAENLYTDADGYTYYAVWVNADKDGYSYNASHAANSQILRNTQYNISLTINKIGYPTIDPPLSSSLDVLVEVTPWAVVDQNVIW